MNFKRNFFVITTALVGALALTGCDLTGPSKFSHFEFIEEIQDTHEKVVGDGYVKYGNYDTYKVKDSKGEEIDLGSAYEVMRDHGGASHMKSEGEQKMIVVPVEFSDYKVEKLGITSEVFIENINKAFFGSAKNNEYVSVGEYYNVSSYGKLKLDGKVCDKVYTFPLSVSQIREKKLKRDVLATDYYKKVIDWYKENYDDIADYEVEGLKTSKKIPIYMVYTYPSVTETSEDEENFFWAFTFTETPLSWSSYSFMNLQYGSPDAHTYIHETGHLLGLTDYYPTVAPKNEETVVIEPTSRIDMMDCSIGDQTAFSKMMLNWARPTYITDSCQVVPRSFTETGDFILISNNWNNTVFDEYYLIEFYTPTGLNTYDISVGNSEAKLPKVPGIKIYHVDARLAYFSGLKTITGYCSDVVVTPGESNIGFAHDNNTYDEPNDYQKNYLYQLILNNNKDAQTFCAADQNLFRVGDEIPTLKFNGNNKCEFKISIFALEFSRAFLKFEKVQKTTK